MVHTPGSGRPVSLLAGLALVAGLAGCGGSDSTPSCGITALAGATMLLNEFSVPRQTLSVPPDRLPDHLTARLAAGPAYAAIVGRTEDGQWAIGVNGTLPPRSQVRFGVLVMDSTGAAMGVMLYEATPVQGAPRIGSLSVADTIVPLLAIQVARNKIEDPRCPLFPDSLAP